MRMAVLGEAMPARQLFELGAITELVNAGGARDAALALSDRLANGSSATHRRIKTLVNAASDASLAEQLDRERDAMAEAIAAPEAGEGIAAFLDKRTPDFKALRPGG